MIKVYTNYWENRRDDVRKAHGSYMSEEEAIEGIKAWWEINNNNFSNPVIERTNSGALEISYVDDVNYHYRVETREIEGKLPKKTYMLKNKGQIKSERSLKGFEENELLFDELPEPYRDRLIVAMTDPIVARNYKYDSNGKPITEI